MNSTCRTAIAAAVAGGYVLGRTRKAKVAFAIGTFLAGRRFGLTPTALAAEGLRQLRESSQLADLREQIGGELLDAARAAASASADRRFSVFADTLRERVAEDRSADGDENGEDAEDAEEAEDGEESSGRERGREGERKKPPAKKSAAKKAAAKKSAAKKTAPSKKAAQARKRSGPAKKTASGRSSRSTTNQSGR